MSEASEFEGEEEETEAGEDDEVDIRSPSMEADEHDEAEEGETDLGQGAGRGSAEDDEGTAGQARSCTASSTGKRVLRRSRAKGGKMPSGKVVTLSMFDCKYDVVRKAAKARGLRLIASGDDRCNIFWIDVSTIHERFAKIEPWQRINHFPGMSNISRKNRLAQNLGKMRRKFPKDYSFFPKTWVLPHDANDFKAQFDQDGHSKQVYIVKPDNSSKGRGIFLINSIDRVNLTEPQVAQVYLGRPLLLDGFKFDIRMYALITSCTPLRMYKFNDGLVRLCTEEYVRPGSGNLDERCMHLTNYAINKFSQNYESAYEADESERGSKRSLRWLLRWLGEVFGEARAARCWERMGQLCVKTVVSILPTLMREYRTMFGPDSRGTSGGVSVRTENGQEVLVEPVGGSRSVEILGFDIMLDNNLKPWLIEVNTLPSFATDSKVDEVVKRPLIEQTLSVIQAQATDHRNHTLLRKHESDQRMARKNAARMDAQSRTQIKDEANVVVRCRRRIEEVFRRAAPERLDTLDHLMRKYRGREAWLLSSVLRRYGEGAGQRGAGGEDEDADEHEDKEEEERSRGSESSGRQWTGERRSDCLDEPVAGGGDDECVRSARKVGDGEGRIGHRRREASRREGERPEEEQLETGLLPRIPQAAGRAQASQGSLTGFDSLMPIERPSSEQCSKLKGRATDSESRSLSRRASTTNRRTRGSSLEPAGLQTTGGSISAEPQEQPQEQPPEQQGVGEDEEASVLEEEAARLVDFERLYPPLGMCKEEGEGAYADFIAYACEQEHKLLQCGGPQPHGQGSRRRRDTSTPVVPQSQDGTLDSEQLPPVSAPRLEDVVKPRGPTVTTSTSQERRPRRRTVAADGSDRRNSAVQMKSQLDAAERLSRGYSTMVRPNAPPAQDADMVTKLRARQMRAQERRHRLVYQFAKPGFMALKGQTLEFPSMMTPGAVPLGSLPIPKNWGDFGL